LISSIRKGINEGTNIKYNDYDFIIRGVSKDEFNQIKDKAYIDKIYIQESENDSLKELDETSDFNNSDTLNVFIKYKNVKETYKYSSNIVQTLQYSLSEAEEKCEFNDKLLTVYGLMGATLDYTASSQLTYKSTINFSYVIDLMIVLILVVFSIFFIIILYNSFLVTINERKRDYAILNSIGGTEGQVLRMIFLEATIIGAFGIIIGGVLSVIGVKAILDMVNNILVPTSFNFSLVVDIKYVIVALIIILLNTYISAIIPSVKASSTSVIDSIRNNKQIKYKKSFILGKILPIEGRMAITNLKRNKNKYRFITTLLAICMVSFISVSTYINYEKESADLVTDYDVDADIEFEENGIDYKEILDNYTISTGDKIEYFGYKKNNTLFAIVEPSSAITLDKDVYKYEGNKKLISFQLVGLDDNKYNEYINKIKANYGDCIIYNNIVETEPVGEDEVTYSYHSMFNTNEIKLSIVNEKTEDVQSSNYEVIDDENLNGNFVLTDEVLDGFKEIKNQAICTLFVNMDTYNKIDANIQSTISKNTDVETNEIGVIHNNPVFVKVRCGNIIEFSNYIKDLAEKDDYKNITPRFYSLEYQEKMIYIDILQLILRTVMITIVVIGIISAINIINASLFERREEFRILSRIGATNGNINKILIYECLYMFIKALVISVIISIPIIYAIIKHMEKVIIVKKLLIPFGNIGIFVVLLFIISLAITLYSSRFVKNK
jgi:putative ABC transport system permease protein